MPPDDTTKMASVEFRQVMSNYPTGVVAVTAVQGGVPVGMAVNSFTSVSLDPPIVLFCAAHSSTTWPSIQMSGTFAVNVFAYDQRQLCSRFASSTSERFAGVRWEPSDLGSPLLEGAAAWLDCVISEVRVAGDHDIVLGEVHAAGALPSAKPLVFQQGNYLSLGGSTP